MLARRVSLSALALLAALTMGACGGSDNPTGLSFTERLARAQRFQDKADVYASMGASGAAFALENAALSILVGANTGTINVTSNGLAARSIVGGSPVTATTAGSYEGVGMRIRIIDTGLDESSDFLVGWRGGDTPTDLLFAEDFGGEVAAGVFLAPNLEWTATAVDFTFSSLNTPSNCDIPSQILDELQTGAAFSCKVGTVSASLDMSASEPSIFDANAATGSRTAAASVTGFPAVSIIYDYTGAR